MKKLVLFLLVAAAFSSCVKTYDCDCTYTSQFTSGVSNREVVGNKSLAKAQCEDIEEDIRDVYNSPDATCTLK